jgi:hypothetical protein
LLLLGADRFQPPKSALNPETCGRNAETSGAFGTNIAAAESLM